MGKYIVAAIVVILIIAGGYYWFFMDKEPAPQEPTTPIVQEPVLSTYATSTFSIKYPPEFTLNQNFSNDTVVPTKPIAGIKFSVPTTMATGTNLSMDSGVSVEWLPRAKSCTGDIYLLQTVKPEDQTIAGKTYSVASSTDAAAGNRYEEIVFALKDSKPCTAVRYFIHYGAIENYPDGMVREFDRAALLSAFDTIRDSLMWNTQDTTPAATSTPAQ